LAGIRSRAKRLFGVCNVSQEIVTQGSGSGCKFVGIFVVRQTGQRVAEGHNVQVNMDDSEGLLIRLVKTPGLCVNPVELRHSDDVTNYHQEHDGCETRC
jgi:hypothetical protein